MRISVLVIHILILTELMHPIAGLTQTKVSNLQINRNNELSF